MEIADYRQSQGSPVLILRTIGYREDLSISSTDVTANSLERGPPAQPPYQLFYTGLLTSTTQHIYPYVTQPVHTSYFIQAALPYEPVRMII